MGSVGLVTLPLSRGCPVGVTGQAVDQAIPLATPCFTRSIFISCLVLSAIRTLKAVVGAHGGGLLSGAEFNFSVATVQTNRLTLRLTFRFRAAETFQCNIIINAISKSFIQSPIRAIISIFNMVYSLTLRLGLLRDNKLLSCANCHVTCHG